MAQELQFVETEPGKWFYLLEDWNAPKETWDWHEYAQAFGPFASLEAACDHETRSDSDTSGAEIVEHSRFSTSPVIAKLLSAATV
jgi:hypothetical protein